MTRRRGGLRGGGRIAALALALLLPATGLSAPPRPAYAACAADPDPPVCLVRVAAARNSQDGGDLLEGVVGAGAVDLVEPNQALLLKGARDLVNLPQRTLLSLGIETGPDAGVKTVGQAEGQRLLAAIALVTAARRNDHPFDDPTVQRLMQRSGSSRGELAQLGLSIWWSVNAGGNLLGGPLNPAGLNDLYDAMLADPDIPTDSGLQLAGYAYEPFEKKALALLKKVAARPDLSADDKAGAASQLARRGEWRLAQGLLDGGGRKAEHYDIPGVQEAVDLARLADGFDAEAVRRVLDAQQDASWGALDNPIWDPQVLISLEKAGARDALLQLGELYLSKARAGPEDGDARAISYFYGLASEAFRRGGDLARALAAAREGAMTFKRVIAQDAILVDGLEGLDAKAAKLNGWGSEPLIALFRAGQPEEALKIGYLSGYDRYRLETEAGRATDVDWVVASGDWTGIELLTLDLENHPQPAAAGRLLDRLERATDLQAGASDYDWAPQLALIAALAGRPDRMQAYLTQAAARLDKAESKDDAEANDYFALILAREWRKALILSAARPGG